MKKIKKGFVLFGLYLAVFCWLSTGLGQAATAMPDFSLENVSGGPAISSSEFKGNALLVIFFATWCPPCIEEIPDLIKIHKQFSPQGFSVIGLSVDQGGPSAVEQLVKKKAINYPVLMADAKTMQSFGGVYGIPVSFLVNKAGNVVKKYMGYVPSAVLIKDIASVIK